MVLGIVAAPAACVEKKITVEESDLPVEIRKAIDDTFPEGKVLEIEQEVEGEDPGQWDVLVRSGGNEYEVEITPEGVVKESKIRRSKNSAQETGESPQKGKPAAGKSEKWTDSFDIGSCTFSSIGRNRYWILEPGYRLVIENRDEKVAITVLDETEDIGGIETRVVEEREWEDGELKEVSRNFFAICTETGDVFYFGEEVDDYKDGKITGHGGAWRADAKDSKAGIIMPGRALLGARHYQEMAPNAMDRAEIVADDVTMKTPAGTFTNCIRVEETSPLEPGDICYKTYAPGVGLIQDEGLLLTRYGMVEDEEDEKVLFDDLPPAVRATLEKHAASGRITEIEKETEEGETVYEAEVILDGKEVDIIVSAEGKYLGKEQEGEEAQKTEREELDDDDSGEDD